MSDKQKSILKRFLLFILLLAIVCLIGISNIFALETKTIYSVNNNGTLASANTYNYGYLTGGGTIASSRANVNTTISGKSYGFMFLFYENVVLNKTYTMVINFMDIDLLKSFNSSMVQVSTCNGDTCNLNTLVSVEKSNNTGNSNKLTIKFNPISTGTYILVNLGGNNEAITGVSTFGIKSVTLDSTNQNQDIIDNQTNNTNNIINNNNSNTQDIINNQIQNNQQLIDEIKKGQLTCGYSYKEEFKYSSLSSNQGYYVNNVYSDNANFRYSDLTTIFGGNIYDISGWTLGTSGAYVIALFDSSGSYISDISYKNNTILDLSSYEGLMYIRVNVNSDARNNIIIVQKDGICAPSSYVQMHQMENQTNAINDLNSSITDDSPVDMNSLGNVAGWLPPGPIDSIINLPLSMLNALYSAMQGTCAPLHIPIPYLNNKYLDIPCISSIFSQINGLTTFWTWVGVITSTIMLYKYLLSLYKYYDELTTLQANFISDFGGAP